MWDQILKIVTDILKLITDIAWPIVAVIAIYVFRNPLGIALTNRNVRIGPSGVELSSIPQQQIGSNEAQNLEGLANSPSQITQTAQDIPDDLSTNYNPPFKSIIKEFQNRINHDIPNKESGVKTSRERRIELLLVDNSVALYLERASRYIFGSQIDALALVVGSGGIIERELLRPTYMYASGSYPTVYATYSFEQWVGFLIGWNLVRQEGSQLVIQPAGEALIPYMEQWGYLRTRPLG